MALPERPDDSPKKDGLLSTGDMARLTGNTLRTVRFYEEAGILEPERRSAGGHRLFSRRELDRLQFISDLRAAGLSLEEIRDLLQLKRASTSACAASQAVIGAIDGELARLDQRIAVLSRLRAELAGARRVLGDCQACTDTGFPEACSACGKLAAHGELPTSLRALWSISGKS